MPIARQQIIVMMTALFLVTGGAYYWFNLRDTQAAAMQRLTAQNIEVSADNFFGQIKAGNAANVRDFLKAGAGPGTQDDKGVSALMVAADAGDTSIASLLLARPQDAAGAINLQDSADGKTALIIATEKNDVPMVHILLEHGADIGVTNKLEQTPVMLAIKNKNAALLKMLLAAGEAQHKTASVNETDRHGDKALDYAIRAQDKDIVDMLIAAKADTVLPDQSGITPLMTAAQAGDPAIGSRLIDTGAKPDQADKFGNSPLSIAVRRSHPQFAQMLLEKGADADFHTSGPLPLEVAIGTDPFDAKLFSALLTYSKQVGHLDASVLFDAISHKNSDMVTLLLEHGINVKAVNSRNETLLYQAIENGLEDAAVTLIAKGADINQTGIPGISPIERATKHNEVKVVQKLLAMGVSSDQKTSEGYNLAEMAIYSGYPEVLGALLGSGAKVEKNFGILWAIRDGKGKSVPVLLQYGANPNVMSNGGEPALWLAASAGETEAVSALIRYKAAIDSPNTAQGMTPLAIASHAGQLSIVKLLVEAGATLDAPDAFGMTPLAQAAYMTKPDVVAYLMDKGADVHAADKQGRSIADLAALGEASTARDQVIALLRRKK